MKNVCINQNVSYLCIEQLKQKDMKSNIEILNEKLQNILGNRFLAIVKNFLGFMAH